ARTPHRTPDEISNAGLPRRSLIHPKPGHCAKMAQAAAGRWPETSPFRSRCPLFSADVHKQHLQGETGVHGRCATGVCFSMPQNFPVIHGSSPQANDAAEVRDVVKDDCGNMHISTSQLWIVSSVGLRGRSAFVEFIRACLNHVRRKESSYGR